MSAGSSTPRSSAASRSASPTRESPRAKARFPGSSGWTARPAVVWRTATAPEGFPCRIERIGADATEWDERHQRTSDWSPFNYQLNARVLRSGASVGVARGERYTVDPDGSVSSRELDAHERVQFLVEELGISEEIALQVPDDRPLPPRP